MRDIHETRVGTYHPNPAQLFREVAWTINDTRGTIDQGPACDECGACECPRRLHCSAEGNHPACQVCDDCSSSGEPDCIGLSFAYVCLDGGEALCEACAQKEGIEIVPCDCK